jgi:2'-5' RNA ligase
MENAHLYFVAVLCPKEIDKEISRFKKWMKEQFQCTVALRSPAHITLVKPFWIETNWEDYLKSTLQSCEPGVANFEMSLKGFSSFGKRVLFVDVVDIPELFTLKRKVEDHFLRTFGDSLKKEQMSFQPHVTIANRDLKPSDFDKAWAHFSKKKYEASFIVSEISLLKLNEGKWEVIESRPLQSVS